MNTQDRMPPIPDTEMTAAQTAALPASKKTRWDRAMAASEPSDLKKTKTATARWHRLQ